MRIIFLFSLIFIIANLLGTSLIAQVEPATIKLFPEEDTNPIKTQHTFVATVLDSQGNPVPGQRVDWILSRGPNMVGDIVEHDDMGAIIGNTNEVVKKLGNQYTISYTNEGPVTLNNGMTIEKGQTWLTITSPVEGETHVIAFCPGIRNVNNHKTFAVKYWKDIKIVWPENAINEVSKKNHTFNFHIETGTTSKGLEGYSVRWTLLEDTSSPKGYLGEEAGKTVADTTTDTDGNASVVLQQTEPREGINRVQVQLLNSNGKPMANHVVTKQWISPKIQITKTGPAEGIIGEPVVFTIEVSNPGDADANDVVVKDTLPEGLVYSKCDVEPVVEGKELSWTIGIFPKGASKKILLTVIPKQTEDQKNIVTVFSKEAPPQSAAAIVRIGAPQLYVLKTGSQEVRKGEIANYTLNVKNNGSAVAKDVIVRDTIPAGMKFNGKMGPMTLKWNMGTLNPGEEKSITYSLETPQAGDFENIAQVFVGPDMKNRAVHTTRVVAPDIKISKKGPGVLHLHKGGTYIIKITNEGTGSALDLVVTDTLPQELDFINSEPRGILKPAQENALATVTWKIPEISAKGSFEIKVELIAKKRGQCVNQAKVISTSPRPPEVPPADDEVSVKISGIPAMHISTYDTEDPCEIGRLTIYVIEVRNEGTSPCTNVVMKDVIPHQMEFVDCEDVPVEYQFNAEERMVVFKAYPLLQPGDKLIYNVRCKAVKAGSAKNKAILSYDQFDTPIECEEGTSVYGE